MNTIEHVCSQFLDYLSKTFVYNSNIDTTMNIDLSRQQFGDISSNAAIIIAKELKTAPIKIAQQIALEFKNDYILKIEIAGPGFLNIFLTKESFIKSTAYIFKNKELSFINSNLIKQKYNIEFVSANPTGPLHFGHGRGGIIGDVLANILTFIGHIVTKEFYINDAGIQIKKLGKSLKTRCLQALGQNIEIDEDGYQGNYLIELANECIQEYGADLIDNADIFFEQYAKSKLLDAIKSTLNKYKINFDVWFSETSLHQSNAIEQAIAILDKNGYLYTQDGALWFKSTEFGDDKDRAIKKGNGEYTYVAADIAYLENKIERKYDHLIMILGQDHHSYATRLKAVLSGLKRNPNMLDVILYQLVTLKEDGLALRMSKRAGRIVDLMGIIEEVGPDIARFFYLNKKADAHLDFDIGLALQKTDENPVFYIQYAYVRTKSILKKAAELEIFKNINEHDAKFINDCDKILIKKILHLKDLLTSINRNYQTHLLSHYTIDLAQTFHSYYNANKVLDLEHIEISRARLVLINIVKDSFELCFKLLGISAPENM